MSLLITIIEFPQNCTVAETSKTFGEQGGTIGRAAENYWVLSDPDCFLSACHCEVSFENGHYLLTDTSTNGTFLNGSREPVGKGNNVKLQDGDIIELSDYKFSIKIQGTAYANTAEQNDPFVDIQHSNTMMQDNDLVSNDAFSSGEIAAPQSFSPTASLLNSEPDIVDPLAALDKKLPSQSAAYPANSSVNTDVINPVVSGYEDYFNASQSDHADVLAQSVIWPASRIDENVLPETSIPEDWDLNDDDDIAVREVEQLKASHNATSSFVANNTMVDANTIQALRAENEKLHKQISTLKELKSKNIQLQQELRNIKKQFLAYQKSRRNNSALLSTDTSMMTAMGLSVDNLSAEKITAINKIAGEMLRETVKGMMQVLTSRNSIKNEFRMNITTIQPVENNPLKFSANVDDALENMFLKSGSSYKKPVDAIKDGFDGIAEHQIAILAGIRAAFRGAIERFEPEKLQARFDKQNQGFMDFIPVFKKAHNWNRFVLYFSDLTDDMDNSFQYLFGDEFVRAYEDQLQQLLVARKSKEVV